MKQILLLFIFAFISFTGFSQMSERHSTQLKKTPTEINAQIDLKVFPNPCTGRKLTVEIDNKELAELRISNIAGKVVILKRFLIPVNKVEINMDNTPNGIYLIQAKTSDNKLVARKLIVSGQ